jgi:hypothetical protein
MGVGLAAVCGGTLSRKSENDFSAARFSFAHPRIVSWGRGLRGGHKCLDALGFVCAGKAFYMFRPRAELLPEGIDDASL